MANNVTVRWYGARVQAIVRNKSKEGVADALEYILQETNKIAPLDEGTLTRSGNIDIESVPKVQGTVYYDTPYAARLHEHPEYNFQNGREGKYLEKVIKREKDTVREYIRRRMEQAL